MPNYLPMRAAMAAAMVIDREPLVYWIDEASDFSEAQWHEAAGIYQVEIVGKIPPLEVARPEEPPMLKIEIPDLGFDYGGAAPGSRKYAATPSKHMPHQGNREMQRRLKRMKGKTDDN